MDIFINSLLPDVFNLHSSHTMTGQVYNNHKSQYVKAEFCMF